MNVKYPKISNLSPDATNQHIADCINQIRSQSTVGLHLGCGSDMISDLINCDQYSSSADLHLNAVDLRCFDDEAIDLIENNHMIEHLSFDEVIMALREWNRVLKTDGWLIITCPDLDAVAKLWLTPDAGLTNGISKDYILKMMYGSQENAGMFHKSGFNHVRLTALLEENGFSVEFSYTPYPDRTTPSLLVIAHKIRSFKERGNGVLKEGKIVADSAYYRDKRFSSRVESYKNLKSNITDYVINNQQDGALAIYGTGDLCEIIVSALNGLHLVAIVDGRTDNVGSTIHGLPVISIEEIAVYGIKNIVIASTTHKKEIEIRLTKQLTDQTITLIPLHI